MKTEPAAGVRLYALCRSAFQSCVFAQDSKSWKATSGNSRRSAARSTAKPTRSNHSYILTASSPTRGSRNNDCEFLRHVLASFLLRSVPQSAPRLRPRLEQPGKGRSHVDEDRGPQYSYEKGQRKPAWGHQGMESKNVDNHRRQHCHRQRYVAVEQQKYTCDDLKREDHPQVMRDIKGTHELTSNTRWRGKGMKFRKPFSPITRKITPARYRATTEAVLITWFSFWIDAIALASCILISR